MIGVVVLTYAPAPGMLEDCLGSLREPYGAPVDEPVRIVLVDNGGVAARLDRTALDGVEVLSPASNAGFAGGMNVGVRHLIDAGARAVMILNDDVVVEPGWLGPLVRELDDQAVGAVQPKLLFDTEPPTINSLGVQLGPDGAGTDIGRDELDDPTDDAPRDLEIFTGGAVLLRDRFITDTGGFDERFFLYYEDVDLSLRGRELGWRYRLAPVSRVRHRGSATTATIGDRAAMWRERNRIWVLLRHRPWGEVRRGLWLAVRRVRWAPRRAHAIALMGGLAAAPRLLSDRRHTRRASRRQ